MLIAILTLALLASGTSATAANQSQLPATRVRSLGLRAIHRAHSKARAARRTQDNIGAIVCGMMSSVVDDPSFTDAMEEEGVKCSQFGCDEAGENLRITCSIDGPICSEGHDHRRRTAEADHEEFCAEKITVDMSIELDFENESEIKSKQCYTYTKPAELAALGPGCHEVTVLLDYGGMMEASQNADPNMSEEDKAIMMVKFIQITECSASFDDGTTCACGMCDEGMGFELTCSKNNVVTFESEECTDFDTDIVPGATADEGASPPRTSIVMLSAAKSDAPDGGKADPASPAASRTEAMAFAFVLAFASLLAVM